MDDRSDEAVYAAYSSELVRFAAGIVGPDDAPDVVVEAFLRVARSSTWSRARDKRALWYRAVVFEARSWNRSTTRRHVREQRVAATVPTTVVEARRDDRVTEALAVLSSQQRAVVMLTYWADLDPPGVGRLLGISEGAVRKQLARARRKLKGELGHG
ncbi:MAG: RNA polymerase sigma factor [Actinomycetota bacterium]